jgi:apolipoprotein N-acyltransferase
VLLSFRFSSRLAHCADYLRTRTGWHRALTAFAFGALSALTYSPIPIVPILWVSFPALIFLIQGTRSARQAFVTGWCFAFGFFLLDLYWIAASMFVDLASFWWAIPLAVGGLPAFFAIYYGLAAIAMRWIGRRTLEDVIAFGLFWFLADYMRGHCFTGFPWNVEGYVWVALLPVLQATSLIGIYGLTLLTLLFAGLPVLLVDTPKSGRVLFCASLVMLAGMAGWGSWRLAQDAGAFVPNIRLRLVQPNVDQRSKWVETKRAEHFQRLLELSSTPAAKPITHLIWPETASTYLLAEDRDHRHALSLVIPKNGDLLTGVVRRNVDDAGKSHFFNSLIAINSRGDVVAGYDKFHLVPFGEYIPLRNILPFHALVSLGDFSTGDGPHSLRVLSLPLFSPLVCYEIIFSGEVAARDDRPGFLLNVTNDGWYGATAGPYQHFAIARTRAVEEGLPLVRAANTGISGVVDSYGQIITHLGVGQTGIIDSDLPQALPATLFVHYGERPLWLIFALLACSLLWLRVHKRHSKRYDRRN